MATAVDSPHDGKRFALVVLLASLFAVLLLTFQHFLPARYIQLLALGAIACVIGLVLFAHPKHALLLAVFYIYASLTYYFKVPAGYPIIAMVIAAVILNAVRGEQAIYPTPGFNWALGLFAVLTAQSLIFAWDIDASLAEILRFVRSLVMVYLVVHLIRTPVDLRNYAMMILASVLIMLVMGVVNIFFGIADIRAADASGTVRFASTHIDPNSFAVVVASALPIALLAIRLLRRWFMRAAIVGIILFMVFMIFSSFSRAAVFPVGFVVLVVMLRDVRGKWGFTSVGALVVGILVFVPAHYWQKVNSLQQLTSSITLDWSLRVRLMALHGAWDLFLDNLLTGVGLGNFPARSGSDVFQRMVAHNAYLEVAVGVGLFGIAAYLTMLGFVFAGFRKAIRTKWPAEFNWMPHVAFYMMVSFGSVLVGAIFLSMPFEYLIWLPAAAGLVAGRMAERYAIPQKKP